MIPLRLQSILSLAAAKRSRAAGGNLPKRREASSSKSSSSASLRHLVRVRIGQQIRKRAYPTASHPSSELMKLRKTEPFGPTDHDRICTQHDGRGRSQGHLGLAEPDVAANDPVHGMAGPKIIKDVPNGLRLVDRREIRETCDKPLIEGTRRYKFRSSAAAAPL
jgi:hypothetical protein